MKTTLRSLALRFRLCCYVLFFFLPVALRAQDKLVGLTSTGGPNNGGTALNILSNGTGFSISNLFTANGGTYPKGGVVQGSDGNFYGMTTYGGGHGYGTIFKITSTGALTIINNLDYYTTGGAPYGSLIKGKDGNFYGLAYYGGKYGYGTIFKITSTGTLTVLKNLSADTTGAYPEGNLVQALDGNFYGMTYTGSGANLYGTIFKITPGGTFTKLKSFDNTHGGYPQGNSLVQGADSALYGMTTSGGTTGIGVIFKIKTNGTGYTVLKNLDGTSGYYPYGSLLRATDGYFYGLASSGGTGYGTLFRISSGGSFTVRKNFDYSITGGSPRGTLVQGTDGLLYGMTYNGASYGYGAVFKSTTGGTATVIKTFDATTASGAYPLGSLFQATDGNFYGLTANGGIVNEGTFFKISSSGSYKLLTSFGDAGKGYTPNGSLVQAKDGNYYGTAYQGGQYNYGTVYKLCTSGSFTTLRAFNASAGTGANPNGKLLQAADGNFYGTTIYGGSGYGTIFKITPSGTLTTLKKLSGASTGYYPYGALVAGNDSTFYGMTVYGGTHGYGVVFKITTKGVYTVLKNLAYDTTGGYAFGSLVKGTDGNFYGMTYEGGNRGYGTIFKITPAGVFTIIKNLDYYSSGGYGYGNSLIQGSDGYFYGMTYAGGSSGYGVIFKINSTGSTFVVLKSFDNTTTGGYPRGDLVQGSGGTLYGFTSMGGIYNGGTIFKISTSGSGFTVLRNLNPATDGGTPLGSLVIQKPDPKANPQSFSTVENTSKKVKLTSTSSGIPVAYAVSTAPKNGTASITKDTLTYTPKTGYVGKDSLYFTVTWGCQKSTPAKISISVTAAAVTVSASNSKSLAVEDIGALHITALPNPSANSFTLTLRSKNDAPIQLQIVNVMGQVVESRSTVAPNSTLQVGETYRPGIYIVHVQQGSEKAFIKLVKQ